MAGTLDLKVHGKKVLTEDDAVGGGGGLVDGDYGDITVSGTGTVMTVNAGEIDESDVNGLVADLAGKAASVHTHAESDVTSLVSDLAGKASVSHTHPEADVLGRVFLLMGA